ncbi:TetR family transcriptional regulator [Prescottella equi]
MTSLRERNRTRTRRDIENAALELFEKQGYDPTSVDEIAELAGVSRATFFRYYPSKEEVLFTNEADAVAEMVAYIADREDPRQHLAALATPVAQFGRRLLDDDSSEGQRLTRLVMTTRELEARSMRMRLRWERGIARQLARERGESSPASIDILLANMAVACLAAALWTWQASPEDTPIEQILEAQFATALELCRPESG